MARRRAMVRRREPSAELVESLIMFKHSISDLELNTRERRAFLLRIKRSRTPQAEAQLLAAWLAELKPYLQQADLMEAFDTLRECPAYLRRSDQRKTAIRRVVRSAHEHYGRSGALTCAERIAAGAQWLGATWLGEAGAGRRSRRRRARQQRHSPARSCAAT